ncbi:MAG: nucleoside kinase [Bacteroidales bacterium]|nr:nucleoside kinase [Bacteroidales bacterium]
MEKVRVFCSNNSKYYEVDAGTNLKQLLDIIDYDWDNMTVLAAYVNHDLKELGTQLYLASTIHFITYRSADGRRCYNRSLNFLCQKVIHNLFPDCVLCMDYHLPNGQYGELRKKDDFSKTIPMTEENLVAIREEMQKLVDKNLPFIKTKKTNSSAINLFRRHGQEAKARLTEMTGDFFVTLYYMDGYGDYFYGPMVYSTGDLDRWSIKLYSDGFCLQSPEPEPPYSLPPQRYQKKLAEIFEEYSNWCNVLGVTNIATVNDAINKGYGKLAISLCEALHERKYSRIADLISERRKDVKLVLIAGPSSSGKTTTSKRVALQMKILGLNPVVIGMDDYFVNRELTPKDEKGEYDFESVYALNLEMLNDHINKLFKGEEVTLPKFNFTTGKSTMEGPTIRMKEGDMLVMEGIHALNPVLTEKIADERKFKIYASALTSLSIDENNYISTTDNRMLRRMVRDYAFRGYSAEETINRWPSVIAGERRNIFPYQENADIMFNSSLLYELPLLKYFAEPLLRRISPMSYAYAESLRLLNFLSRIVALNPEEQKMIPPTSVMREFIGDSVFTY